MFMFSITCVGIIGGNLIFQHNYSLSNVKYKAYNKLYGYQLKHFSKTQLGHIGGSYRPILIIFNIKYLMTTLYLVCNFEDNWSKIATMRVLEWKKYKMAAMTSSNSKFPIPRKLTLGNICQILCGKFRLKDTQTPLVHPNMFSQN